MIKLRELLASPEPELRYGAFNAIRAVDPRDYALGRTQLVRFERPEPPQGSEADSMAYKIAVARQLGRRRPDPFELYVVDADGPPMVHISNTQRAEVVIFGAGQKLLTPLVLGGPGSVMLNANLLDDRVEISRMKPGDLDRPGASVVSKPQLSEVLRRGREPGGGLPGSRLLAPGGSVPQEPRRPAPGRRQADSLRSPTKRPSWPQA